MEQTDGITLWRSDDRKWSTRDTPLFSLIQLLNFRTFLITVVILYFLNTKAPVSRVFKLCWMFPTDSLTAPVSNIQMYCVRMNRSRLDWAKSISQTQVYLSVCDRHSVILAVSASLVAIEQKWL